MSGSSNSLIFNLYKEDRTVFSLPDVGMLFGQTDFKSLNARLNYYVRTGKLLRPRKGVYAKPGYNPEELGCILYTPSYLSLEYVLQKEGIVFQYEERLTAVSYLSRTLAIDRRTFSYRKIKNEILINTNGIQRKGNINVATPERAFLDILYLNSNFGFDNIAPLNQKLIKDLLPLYNSPTLTSRVNKIISG